MKMSNKNQNIKISPIRNINIKPPKLSDKIKFYTNKNYINNPAFKNKYSENNIPNKNKKIKMQNKTFLGIIDKQNLQKIKLPPFKKKISIDAGMKHNKSDYFNRIKKIRCSSQDQIQKMYLKKNINELLNNNYKKEKEIIDESEGEEENEKVENINISEFMERIKKEFSDIGKLIKISFILDNGKKYDFEKNEFILLKIIENDLKENQGLNIKEFVFNEKKLNKFKSLKDNNIVNNSIIKIIL